MPLRYHNMCIFTSHLDSLKQESSVFYSAYFLSPHADIKKTLENTGFPRVLIFFVIIVLKTEELYELL